MLSGVRMTRLRVTLTDAVAVAVSDSTHLICQVIPVQTTLWMQFVLSSSIDDSDSRECEGEWTWSGRIVGQKGRQLSDNE